MRVGQPFERLNFEIVKRSSFEDWLREHLLSSTVVERSTLFSLFGLGRLLWFWQKAYIDVWRNIK